MYEKILVPVDGSAASLRGLDEAIRLAKALNATLRIIHVVNNFPMDIGWVPAETSQSMLDTLRPSGRHLLGSVEEVARKQGACFEVGLLETIAGRPADLIDDDAKNWPADLIIMGTHGRRGLRRLALGSDAEMVLRSSPVPVLRTRDVAEGA